MGALARKFESQADLHRKIGEGMVLSAIESIALECLKQIASEGRRATHPELCAATGATYQQGTITAVLNRLERKGYITRQYFQRGMVVCITSTGQCTLPPKDTSPHWRNRDRTNDGPAPAIHMVHRRMPQETLTIEQEARRLGKSMSEFLADLVYIGWAGYRAEMEGGIE